MKTETQKQIEKLEKEVGRINYEINNIKLKVLSEGENKFEVGKWYKLKSNKNIVCIYTKEEICVGIDSDNKWSDDIFMTTPHLWTLATDTEVLEALTKEADRKYPLGTKIRTLDGNEITLEGYRLWIKGSCLFASEPCGRFYDKLFDAETCKWATIIEDEKIYIGENEVVFTNSDVVWIGGVTRLTIDNIKALLPSNPTLFGKILKRMKG